MTHVLTSTTSRQLSHSLHDHNHAHTHNDRSQFKRHDTDYRDTEHRALLFRSRQTRLIVSQRLFASKVGKARCPSSPARAINFAAILRIVDVLANVVVLSAFLSTPVRAKRVILKHSELTLFVDVA